MDSLHTSNRTGWDCCVVAEAMSQWNVISECGDDDEDDDKDSGDDGGKGNEIEIVEIYDQC